VDLVLYFVILPFIIVFAGVLIFSRMLD